jgi:excisionase family DNA binding protein
MMTRTTHEQGYYTKESAKFYTGLSQRTLEYAVSEGKLRAFKVGKRVLFAKEDLDRFVRQRQTGTDLDQLVDETITEVLGK